MADRGRVKGATIRATIEWYTKRFGAGRVGEIVNALPVDMRSLVDPASESLGILAAQWYPAELMFAVIELSLAGLSPTQQASFATSGAKLTTEQSITGIHRAIFRIVGTPDLYARFAQRLWNAHYDNGSYVARPAPGGHAVDISGWRSHHPLLCTALLGSSVAIYEAMGLKGVRVQRLTCVGEGAPSCSLRVDFRG